MKIRLKRVYYIPKELEPGVLYVSEEFGAAVHLCPCGCGSKVSTPLGPTDWKLKESENGPTLYPSIGNWQLPCQSHYWINDGNIIWSEKWTPEHIAAGRRAEEKRNMEFYKNLYQGQPSIFHRFWNWIRSLLLRVF